MNRTFAKGLSGLGLAFSLPVAQAQTMPASQTGADSALSDIVVTAQRRSERLQDVPIAVTAISGEALSRKGLTDTQQLAGAVPGLTFTTVGASGTPFIRGVGSNAGDTSSEPSVATYVDGVYIATPNANVFEFNSVENIEVLKGPQGTLFGRNATGGVILVTTRNPSFEPSVEGRIGYANYDTITGSAYLTSGITDNIAFNVAGQVRDQGRGYGRNIFSGHETYYRHNASIRAKLLFNLGEDTQAILQGDYARIRTGGGYLQVPNGVVAPDGVIQNLDRFDTRAGEEDSRAEKINTRTRGLGLTVTHDFSNFSVKSITSLRRNTGREYADVEGAPDAQLNLGINLYQHNFSQEVHLLSADDSKIQWLVGGFYYDSTAGYKPSTLSGSVVGGIVIDILGLIRTRSLSAFAQATAEVLPNTKLTGGLRFTRERQDYRTETDSSVGLLSPLARAHQIFNKPTWRVSLDHKFGEDMLGYVSYNRGIKSGGYPPQAPVTESFRPEQVDAYEAGLKTQLFDRHLRLNMSAFWYEQKDLQVQIFNGETGPTGVTQNAAAARTRGFDVDFEARPMRNLTFSGGLAYVDGRYKNYGEAASYGQSAGGLSTVDASGNRTIKTPEFSGSFTADLAFPTDSGTFNLSGTALYTGKFYWAADNRPAQDAYTVYNATFRWTTADERFNISLWAKNLTGKKYLAQLLETQFGDLVTQADPATYGITGGFKF
ncbi:iron complex outermembrane recepter protein [Sphingobium faniae]|nr:iron complex outermembrane recepter protein [Sphingobium faniae]